MAWFEGGEEKKFRPYNEWRKTKRASRAFVQSLINHPAIYIDITFNNCEFPIDTKAIPWRSAHRPLISRASIIETN